MRLKSSEFYQRLCKFLAASMSLLIVNCSVPGVSQVPPGHEIELEQYQSQNQAQVARSPLLPESLLDLSEFNDFNYMQRPYEEPKAVSNLIEVEFEPTHFSPESSVPPQKAELLVSPAQQKPSAPSNKKDNSNSVSIIGVSPENEVSDPTEITVTFSKDMLGPFTTLDFQPIVRPPVTISPPVEGTWHWFSPRVLVFKPKSERLPRSTEFTVSVSKSFKSPSNLNLSEGKTWKFSTQHPVLTGVSGGLDGYGLSVPLLLNQSIKIASALSKIHMTVDGKEISLRRAAKEEANTLLGDFMNKEGAYCFVPTAALPSDRDGKVVIEEGIEALEGPLRSTNSHEHNIHTQADRLTCTSPEVITADVGVPWSIDFKGPINPITGGVLNVSKMTKEMFSITPGQNLKITTNGQTIFVRGRSGSNQENVIRIDSTLPGFKGTLGEDIERKLVATTSTTTVNAEVMLLPSAAFVVTPTEPTKLSILSRGTAVVLATIFEAATVFGANKIPLVETPEGELSKKVPIWQKRLPCTPFSGDLNLSVVDLNFLQKSKQKQFVLYVTIPQQPFRVDGMPIRRSDSGITVANNSTLKNSQSKFESISDTRVATWIQLVSTNTTSLTSDISSKIICTSLSDGRVVDAISATALPDQPFTKTGIGVFSSPLSLHVQGRSGVKILEKSGTTMLPNQNQYSHWEHEDYKIPKLSVFCTGDFGHANQAQPLKFAGFLNAQKSSGERCAASDGEITFVAEDSDGNKLNSGSTRLQNGFFTGKFSYLHTPKPVVERSSLLTKQLVIPVC